ncbi:MAG: nucleoid-associated protein [Lachnospiraceae bacterium]|nr:nucleoid-associated protein [Lachnospiraceae bacterium]
MALVKEEINLRKAILHILDSTTGQPILSDQPLEYGSEFSEFIKGHIANVFGGDESKKCAFHEKESEVFGILDNYDDENFVNISKELAQLLYSIMNANIDIPSADLFVVRFMSDSLEYLGILKMNYKPQYTHRCSPGEGGMVNEIYRYKELLPAGSQKLSEAAIIRLTDLAVWVVEKKAEINGKKEDYFSEYFLKCSAKLSDKKKLAIVTKAIETVNNQGYEDMFRYEPQMKAKAIINTELEKNGGFTVEAIADKVYEDRPDLKDMFHEKMERFDMRREEVAPVSENTTKKYQKQCLVTDSGIEIKIPMSQYEEEGNIEFVTNPDGTISLYIKNIGNISAKF